MNTNIEKDSLVDKENNPVFLALGNSLEERAKRYKEFTPTLLDEDKLKAIRRILSGQSHFASKNKGHPLKCEKD